jgi:hypothetical protein
LGSGGSGTEDDDDVSGQGIGAPGSPDGEPPEPLLLSMGASGFMDLSWSGIFIVWMLCLFLDFDRRSQK